MLLRHVPTQLSTSRRVGEIVKSDYWTSSGLSAWNNSAPTGRISMKFDRVFFPKSVQKIQVSLKSDENNGYCTCRLIYIYEHISSNSSSNEKYFRQNQNMKCKLNNFSSKILPFMWQCAKILYNWSRHRWQYGACALHAGYQRLQTHTHNIQ